MWVSIPDGQTFELQRGLGDAQLQGLQIQQGPRDVLKAEVHSSNEQSMVLVWFLQLPALFWRIPWVFKFVCSL